MQKTGLYGTKMFFYASQVIDPYERTRDPKQKDDTRGVRLHDGGGCSDWAWVTKGELGEYLDSDMAGFLQHALS